MTIKNFKEAKKHLGHKIEIVMYAEENITIECKKCNEVLVEFQKEIEQFQFGSDIITLKKMKNIEKELEDNIYNAGMYRKMSGNWDINVEFNEELSQDCEDDREKKDNLKLCFDITATNCEEDGKTADSWAIIVEFDDKLKILSMKKY